MNHPYKAIKEIKVSLCEKNPDGVPQDHYSRGESGLVQPYTLDYYNMGEAFSPSIEMMYSAHASDGPEKREDIKERTHCYLVCKVSGKRWRIDIEKES